MTNSSETEARVECTVRALLNSAQAAGLFISGDLRVSEADAGSLLGLAPGSLKNLRHEGAAPPAYRLAAGGCRISYRLSDLAEWIEARRESW